MNITNNKKSQLYLYANEVKHFFIQLRIHSSGAEDGLVYFLIDLYNTKFWCWIGKQMFAYLLFPFLSSCIFFFSSFLPSSFFHLPLMGTRTSLSPNMAPWHITYFNLKDFEKKCKSKNVTLTSPNKLSSLKQVFVSL